MQLIATLVQFSLLALSSRLTAALPSPSTHVAVVERQAGPSGELVTPNGGDTWTTIVDGDLGYPNGFTLSYNGISEPFTRGDFTYFQTIGIDVYAVLPDFSGDKYYLARGLAPDYAHGNVDLFQAFLIPREDFPHDSNGQFRLVIDEIQFARDGGAGGNLKFRSAAPLLTVVYDPVP